MQSRNTNKIGIQCTCWFYSQGIVRMHGHTILKNLKRPFFKPLNEKWFISLKRELLSLWKVAAWKLHSSPKHAFEADITKVWKFFKTEENYH